MTDVNFLTLAEAARLIESRQLSPVELTRAMLARIEAIDPQINAFITVTAEQAVRQARAAEAEIAAGRYRGPMHGIPFGLKDVYATAGVLTCAQSKILIDNIPGEDAAVTRKLYAAGGVLLGKLATTEFTHGGPSGCLFEASDYVQAQRERQRMLAEMQPLYQKYDVLITAGSGAAPRFDRFSMLNAWIKPNIYNVFNVTGGPCISICIGFTGSGLPLSMQIAGRPFADQTVLRAAYAYEQATAWRQSRPRLTPNAPRVEVTVPPLRSSNVLDEATRRIADQQARRAGLELNEMQFAVLCEVAPHALALAQRLRRDHPYSLEPASAFRLGQ